MARDRENTSGKSAGKGGREERLKAALKANIARRKAQARARKSADGNGQAATEDKD